jgi:hypothetical protein
MKKKNNETLISIAQLSTKTNIHMRMIHRLIAEGRFKTARKIGQMYIINANDPFIKVLCDKGKDKKNPKLGTKYPKMQDRGVSRLCAYVSCDMHKSVKSHVIKQKTTISLLVEKLLSDYMHKVKQRSKTKKSKGN